MKNLKDLEDLKIEGNTVSPIKQVAFTEIGCFKAEDLKKTLEEAIDLVQTYPYLKGDFIAKFRSYLGVQAVALQIDSKPEFTRSELKWERWNKPHALKNLYVSVNQREHWQVKTSWEASQFLLFKKDDYTSDGGYKLQPVPFFYDRYLFQRINIHKEAFKQLKKIEKKLKENKNVDLTEDDYKNLYITYDPAKYLTREELSTRIADNAILEKDTYLKVGEGKDIEAYEEDGTELDKNDKRLRADYYYAIATELHDFK